MPFVFSNVSTGFQIAFRSFFFRRAAGFLVTLAVATLLSAQFSGRHPNTVALDIGISVMRLTLPLFIILTTQELLSREFDHRYFLNTLSYPHTRHALILGRFTAITILTLGLLVVLATALALLVWLIGKGYAQITPTALGRQYVVTIAFLGVDLLLLAAVASLLAVVASTPSFVLIGTVGFMLVGRSFESITELLIHNTSVVSDAESYRSGIGLLSYLLPNLGALDVRAITLYGRMEFLPTDWPWLVLSSLSYAAGLLALAVWTLQRKRFA